MSSDKPCANLKRKIPDLALSDKDFNKCVEFAKNQKPCVNCGHTKEQHFDEKLKKRQFYPTICKLTYCDCKKFESTHNQVCENCENLKEEYKDIKYSIEEIKRLCGKHNAKGNKE